MISTGPTHAPALQVCKVCEQYVVAGVYTHTGAPDVSHVPTGPYVVSASPVQNDAGGVVQLLPPQSARHDAVEA
jgi:hypothetical protein